MLPPLTREPELLQRLVSGDTLCSNGSRWVFWTEDGITLARAAAIHKRLPSVAFAPAEHLPEAVGRDGQDSLSGRLKPSTMVKPKTFSAPLCKGSSGRRRRERPGAGPSSPSAHSPVPSAARFRRAGRECG